MDASEALPLIQTTAVLITLIILIYQTRQNTKALRISSYQNALRNIFEYRSDIIADKGVLKSKALSTYLKKVYSAFGTKQYYHTLKLFHTYEVFFLLHKENIIDQEMWTGWKSNLKISLSAEGNRDIWNHVKKANVFHPGFAQLIDDIIQQIKSEEARMRVAST